MERKPDWLPGFPVQIYCNSELNLVQLFGRDGKILRNVYVPKPNGETSEIDVLFLTQKGIFVIESKNYSGWIFGDEQSVKWTASMPTRSKFSFYNPIKQNRTHIKWLSQYLECAVPFYSLIVFSERCELKKIEVSSKDVYVIKRDRLYATVRDIWDRSPDALSEEQINSIFSRLQPLTNADEAIKTAHIQQIKEKYAPTSLVCPICGSKLVLRTSKKGPNAGQEFYGCSAFPKCRFTKPCK